MQATGEAGAPPKETDEFRRLLLEGLSDAGVGFVVVDGRRILTVNDAFARMVGRDPHELVGLDTTLLIVPEERAQGVVRQRARLARERDAESFRCQLLRPDGSKVLAHVTGRALRGDPPRFLAIVRDVTEEERARDALHAARTQIAQSEKLSALGSLVSGVAHEIRTPLAYLQNSLFLLQRKVDRAMQDERVRATGLSAVDEQTAMALEATERITRLVDDLRRFTRLKPGERTRVPLSSAIKEGVELFQATHRARVELRTEIEPTPETLVDALEAQQVVLNLLENAVDASPPGGVVRVRIRPEGHGGAHLVVEDSGLGIAPEVLPHIFDPFFTTKAHGTGLGLSIVKRIAESAGAEVHCESEPGRGTRFVLRFRGAGGATSPSDRLS